MRNFLQLEATLEVPCTTDVSILGCQFYASSYQDELFEELGVQYPVQLNGAVPKRRAEYLCGRYLARRLLESRHASTLVTIGKFREPVWPEGWIGSITHTHNQAVCSLASREKVAMLGIDMEPWFSDESSEQVSGQIVNSRELRILQEIGSYSRALTLAFSAKESFFKAVFPTVRQYFGFDSVEVVELDSLRQRIKLRINYSLASCLEIGSAFEVGYIYLPSEVFTLAILYQNSTSAEL